VFFFIWSGGEIGKRSVWVATIGSTRSNRQTRCTGSNPVLTTKLNTMNEQQIQTKIKRKLIERGWYVTKLIKTSTNGIPDLLAIKYGKAMFIEVKREGGRLSPIQELRIEELKAAGAIVKIWTDFDTDFI
jgi:HJR/Mrr/RecB family endonuclease